ncbi:hypothetical protein [Parasphingorhabdus sp.]|uniref:FliH/SctL family protein n=1 Tax=Parasphingorhabdus sp. TaxID=2709688 RepID=UPI002F92DF7D
MQDPDDRFVASYWQVEESAFRPAFDLKTRQPKDGGQNNNGSETDNIGEEEEEKLAADLLAQKTADAYAQGYLSGQQAITAQLDEIKERRDDLAAAINRLKPADEGKLAKLLWEAVLSLLRQAVGHAEIDRLWLQERCEAALGSIDDRMGEACLYVAPGDVILLQEYDCGVPVVADAELLPGSVRLAYLSGQITYGSLSIVQELESRAGVAGGASC